MNRISPLLILLWVCFALPTGAEESQPVESEAPESAEEEAPAIPEAMIRIVSTPSSATIHIDGQYYGLTPANLALSPGRHEVRISSPFQSYETVIEAGVDQFIELDVVIDGSEQARSVVETTEWVDQVEDNEVLQQESLQETSRDDRPRRDFRWPWAELHFIAGPAWRTFTMPISPEVDIDFRSEAAMDSGAYGVLGFTAGVFPFLRSEMRAIRGLGIESEAQFGVGLEVFNAYEVGVVDSDYYSAEVLLSYRAIFGTSHAGVTILSRFGWHRTSFYLGSGNNSLVPPMVYDALRVEIGLLVPLGVPFLQAEARLAYLPVVGTNQALNEAYNTLGADPESSHGVEFRAGLRLQFSRFQAGIYYIGRWIITDHEGVGAGYGRTECDYYSCGSFGGIESTGDAKDTYHQMRLSLGVLL